MTPPLLTVLVTVLLAASVVAALSWILRRGIALLPLRRQATLERARPALEVLLAVLALAWIASVVFAVQPRALLAGLAALLAILVAAGWFAVRDVISGAVLRAENVYEVGQWLRVAGMEGRIRQIGVRSIEIESDDGSRTRLPYSQLVRAPLARSGRGEGTKAHTFTVTVPPSMPAAGVVAELRAATLSSFFASATRDPQIRHLPDSDGRTFELTVYAPDATFLPEVEAAVRRRLLLLVERSSGAA